MIKYQFEYDLDDVRTNLAHREIILQKEFFKRIYEKWYSEFVNASKISPPGIFMINVFHLIPDAAAFLKEAMRTLKSAGKIILIEPASSFWGRIIYGNLHHEPFDPKGNWTIPSTGTLSGANIALPWIVFERDKTEFKKQFPEREITSIKYHTPILYLLSGGVSRKALVPFWTWSFFNGLENVMTKITKHASLFHTITVVKK